jgi:DnaA family protein
MSEPSGQLHLALGLVREPTLGGYRIGQNGEAVAAVTAIAQGDATGEPYVLLLGGQASGKSHLLQAACHATVEDGRTAQYVPLGQPELTPAILDALERRALVAVDDVQRIAGDLEWETALFALFNRARERGCRLLVAADNHPDAIGFLLPDLCSRLQWGPRYWLTPLNDADCEQLLVQVAADLGMRLGAETARYIMNNHARDPASLLALLDRIDGVSLREQRQPSIPLVRRILRGET